MLRPRFIPVLLIQNAGLVKSVKFRSHRYLGDPINAVKIYNELLADELVFLDIAAGKEKRTISIDFVREVGEESNMPFSVGGGINNLSQIRALIKAGAEKVIINTQAFEDPDFIRQAADSFGSSAIVVCIDVKKKIFGMRQAWVCNGQKPTGIDPVNFAQLMVEKGAGELIIQSIERDGMMGGYDLALLKSVSASIPVPVIALGGAGSLSEMYRAYTEANVSGLAAGSLFVYFGNRRGILINYPSREDIKMITGIT